MDQPLVSVICLCYNHEQFVHEAINSVLNQTYPQVELIIIDDASTDNSVDEIKKIVSEHPSIQFFAFTKNRGNCAAFNQALAHTSGTYIVDLAADDVLLPERIAMGVQALHTENKKFGVQFTDAEWIDETGKHLYFHSDKFPHHTIPQGNIYTAIIRRYFVCPPTVMFSRSVIESIGGYDETLMYEDFDFWVRSSRITEYAYTPDVLVKKRVVKRAQSTKQFSWFSPYSASTYRVCEKILRLNQTTSEQQALSERLRYEIRLNIRLLNFGMALKYGRLWYRNKLQRYPT